METFINVHPASAANLRARLDVEPGEPAEAEDVARFVHTAIEVFRSRPDSDRGLALAAGPRWPSRGDDERVPLAITADGQQELNYFLYHDWWATGIGFSEFLRRALADPAIV